MSAPGFTLDSKSILIDALKQNLERFEKSNLILKNGKCLKAIYEIDELRSELLSFAKNPKIGMEMLGPKPRQPDFNNMTDDEAEQAKVEYMELLNMYELQKKALSMHVPFEDMLAINNYMLKFDDTLHATPAIKGRRFHALTKNIEEEQGGMFDFLRRKGNQQQG